MPAHPGVLIVLPGPMSGDPDMLRRRPRWNGLRRLLRWRSLHHDVAGPGGDGGRDDLLRLADDHLRLLGDNHLLLVGRRGRWRSGDKMGLGFRSAAAEDAECAAES